MKRLIICALPLIAFILSGCSAARVIPYNIDRVDQELKGNRGIVTGTASDLPEPQERKKTRRVYDLEVELLSPLELMKSKENEAEIQGKKEVSEKKVKPAKRNKGIVRSKDSTASGASQPGYQEPTEAQKKYKKEKGTITLIKEEKAQKTYVVEKGDTLQTISDKVYGTTRKWKKIYEANRDVLESPDMIKPGQKLVIPE